MWVMYYYLQAKCDCVAVIWGPHDVGTPCPQITSEVHVKTTPTKTSSKREFSSLD